jgi:hypothetical protein
MRRRLLSCLVFFSLAKLGAEAPPLENAGRPMRIPFECTDDDIRAAGLTCPPDHPCPVYLELAAVEAVGNRLFLAGNVHADTVTLASVLLASQDGGKTWTEPHERVRGAGLDLVQFIDFETGWIGGQAFAAVTRDPFLLLTRDGGKSWSTRPVFAESRTGALDSFHFDSKTHGWLWIDRTQAGEAEDRYESYESMTGGESWMVRETGAQPLRQGPRPAGPADWRLRPDSATKAYRLEHRAPSGWETTAAFVVQAGECRETETVLAPEPPVPEQAPSEAASDDDAPAAPGAVPAKPPTLRKPRP